MDTLRSISDFYFFETFTKKLFYAYTEKMLNGKISTKSVYITDNNIKNFKFFVSFYLHYMGCIKPTKPSHATVPLKNKLLWEGSQNSAKMFKSMPWSSHCCSDYSPPAGEFATGTTRDQQVEVQNTFLDNVAHFCNDKHMCRGPHVNVYIVLLKKWFTEKL